MSRLDRFDASEATKEILRYFLRHPQAADTLEGIVRWRLLEERVERTLDDTRRVLEWLVSAGFVVEEPNTSLGLASPVYRLNAEKAAEVESYVVRESNRARPRRDRTRFHGEAKPREDP